MFRNTISATPIVDLNPALSRLSHGRIDMIALETGNPRLHGLLMDAWRQAHFRGDSSENLDGDTAAVLDNFYRDSIRAAPASIQAEYWRLKVDQRNWLRLHGARSCQPIIQDQAYTTRYDFPLDMQDRFLALRVSVWSSVRDAPPPRSASVTIPGAIAAAAARRADLGPDAFRRALRGGASQDVVCAAQIALAETALALPPAESARLLRDLTSIE